jgi:CDP-glucose 4,6-dehydratase
MDLKTIYQNKKIFVTGHTGFKGTWLLHVLHSLGAKLAGYALQPPKEGLFELTGGETLCQHTIADIRDAEILKSKIIAFEPDIIFHLAAQPLVLESYQQPAYTFAVNLMGTINLMEAVRDWNKKCTLVIITTDKVYQDRQVQISHKETDRLGGYDPYSASKATIELAVDSYRNSFFNLTEYNKHQKTIATARAGNVIGGGDIADNRIMPDIAFALLNNKKVNLRNPQAVRPWQHVLDALEGYLILAKQLHLDPLNKNLSGPWNFGPPPDEVLTVEEVTRLAIAFWGNGEYGKANLTNKPHETTYLGLDPAKANTLLNWQPRWAAQEAIRHTMDWYKAVFADKQQPAEITRQQIKEFFQS